MKRLKLLIVCLGVVTASFAAQQDTTRTSIYRSTVSAMMEYSYNKTWGHFGNVDIQALMPVNRHVELNVNLQASFKNVYTVGVTVRPKVVLPYGELFFDTEVLYKALVRVNQMDLVTALSLGYRFDYASVQIGCYARIMESFSRNWHSEDSYQCEPFNLLYRLEVYCRPQSSNWNIGVAFADIDDYQFERMWQPLFELNGRYDIDTNWRVHLNAQCKPTGMFHLNAAFYGFTLRAGFTYRF